MQKKTSLHDLFLRQTIGSFLQDMAPSQTQIQERNTQNVFYQKQFIKSLVQETQKNPSCSCQIHNFSTNQYRLNFMMSLQNDKRPMIQNFYNLYLGFADRIFGELKKPITQKERNTLYKKDTANLSFPGLTKPVQVTFVSYVHHQSLYIIFMHRGKMLRIDKFSLGPFRISEPSPFLVRASAGGGGGILGTIYQHLDEIQIKPKSKKSKKKSLNRL